MDDQQLGLVRARLRDIARTHAIHARVAKGRGGDTDSFRKEIADLFGMPAQDEATDALMELTANATVTELTAAVFSRKPEPGAAGLALARELAWRVGRHIAEQELRQLVIEVMPWSISSQGQLIGTIVTHVLAFQGRA